MNTTKTLMLFSAALLMQSCATLPKTETIPPRATGNVERLMKRPDFDKAVAGSDLWVEDALETVNSLETMAKERGIK